MASVVPVRVAWFSPMPPVRTGIAGRSAELVPALRARGYVVDVFDEPAAHDFVWRHAQHAYDLVVYQFGNSSHHDYIWAYALRYPGLVVLHDTRLHHARAAFLLREKRVADYRAEFAWSQPDVSADLAELAVAGFDSALYYDWPMTRALIASSRATAVHGALAADELKGQLVDWRVGELADRVVSVRLGEGMALSESERRSARRQVRARYGIPDDDVVFGVFGGLTPEKRIPQILAALRATLPHAPAVRLLLAGAPAAHYDAAADIATCGLTDRVTLTGYLREGAERGGGVPASDRAGVWGGAPRENASDRAIAEHLAACDVSLNLRWPSARETSGPWLRALAVGLPTVITDLVHTGDVPSLDPRTWRMNVEVRDPRLEARATEDIRTSDLGPRTSAAVCVAIDILDEDHSLRLAMRRLAADAELRARLGAAAREWWAREHSVEVMVDDYVRVIEQARALPDPSPELPAHTRQKVDEQVYALVRRFGAAVTERIRDF